MAGSEQTQDTEIPITSEYLEDIIKGLSPTRELFAGKKFLQIMLKEKGVQATIDFTNRILDVLDDEDGLSANIDFDEDELAIFKRSSFNFMTRRHFMRTKAWVLCGGAFTVHGGLETLQNALEYIGLEKPSEEPKLEANATTPSPLKKSIKLVQKHVAPPAELICGAALVYEGFENELDLKIKQVARAITKFADKISEKYPQSIIQP